MCVNRRWTARRRRGPGWGTLPHGQLPIAIQNIFFNLQWPRSEVNLVTLRRIATIMNCLQVVPVPSCCLWCGVSKLSPPADRFDLIDDEAERMLCIGWLVVMYLPAAYTTACPHRFEASAVLPSQVPVLIPGVGLGCCSAHRYTPYPLRLFLGDGFKFDPHRFNQLRIDVDPNAVGLEGHCIVMSADDLPCPSAEPDSFQISSGRLLSLNNHV